MIRFIVTKMTLAEQFTNEVEVNESKGKLGMELFYETLLKYKGCRREHDFGFEDGSYAFWYSYTEEWILGIDEE